MSPRQEALIAGQKTYLTDLPCKHGHFSKRLVINGSCCECTNIRQKIKLQCDPEYRNKRIKENRAWKAKNPEKVVNARQDWYKAHKEYENSKAKLYLKEKIVDIRARVKKNALANPIWSCAGSLRGGMSNRAKIKNLPSDKDITKTRDYIYNRLLQQPNCECCETPFDFTRYREKAIATNRSPSIDRFIPELGYTKDNISIICYKCNAIKSNASLDELQTILDWMKKKVK